MTRPASITVGYQMKQFFFDWAVVKRAIGSANARAMAKALAFIRTRARTRIRSTSARTAERSIWMPMHSFEMERRICLSLCRSDRLG
jgi:hypothetical protein